MNEEICCTACKGKMAENEWENDDSEFLQALHSVYKKLGQFVFQTYFLTCLKRKVISSVKSYKYLNKLISKV